MIFYMKLVLLLLAKGAAFVSSPPSTHLRRLITSHEANGRRHWVSPSPQEGVIPTEARGKPRSFSSQSSTAPSKGLLTPYQILHSHLFSSQLTGQDISRPLGPVIKLLRKALAHIIQGGNMDLILGPSVDISVLRIEHTISHSVDPLCWLHAQRQHQTIDTPSVYFSNAEQSMEAAAYGAAHLHLGASSDEWWEFVSTRLPTASHVYGGERFDRQVAPDNNWQEFGNGFWMLPMVELRRKNGNVTTLAVHVVLQDEHQTWQQAAKAALEVLSRVSHRISDRAPPTTLPPVISRDGTYGPDLDAQEVYERGVTAALDHLNAKRLEKVVLARRSDLVFDSATAKFSALDVLKKWKFGGNEGGHLFYLCPGDSDFEFFGCTPEQLFAVGQGKVVTEALAGTRPRGSTPAADAALSRDLFESPKDRSENEITGRFIRHRLREASARGLLVSKAPEEGESYFVRRLLHLQHICQRFERTMETGVNAWDVSRCLLHSLHPTPAVCGFPLEDAQKFIRAKESLAFDRGFYAGPFGYVGGTQAEIVVAIRSGLITKMKDSFAAEKQTRLSVFAGAGIVPGSTVQGEWAETSYKLNVISTLFPQSPIRLLGAATPNVAWATAFVEELIRCGVRQFYVCPGSRSTPLVAALSKALRSNVGVVAASSVHDERGAAFRALGYAKGYGRPAAVITSSGTATANLYPAIMEAGIDGIPMLLLTADRPYESRDTGANQAVDQVKVYSSTYLRWFRDIPPPSDDIPVSLVLSDANHAVKTAVQQKGPVHINIQFRENLAPDAGSIRNDNRVDSVVKFNGYRFTDVPNFHRWSYGGDKWVSSFHSSSVMFGVSDESVFEVARLIRESKRGIIVVGNLHPHSGQEIETQVEAITDFASVIGFPIFAGVQSGSLRCRSPAVIFYAEHLLKAPMVSRNMKPDLIIQLGHPLISTEVPKLIRESMKDSESSRKSIQHVLIHPIGQERAEADEFTVTHRITADIAPFLESVVSAMERYTEDISSVCSSELASLVLLGRMLGEKMPSIIDDASEKVIAQASDDKMLGGETTLTEPQVVMAMSESLQSAGRKYPIFLSNSMPVRDAEFFLYPMVANSLGPIGVNRGASGIDGIVSTALGFAESYEAHIALLIGDLAAIHDLNSFHSLSKSQPGSSRRSPPLTTVVVNNDGGGIFSFLPISKYGKEVNYEDFFGTPTNSFSFEKGAEAFGLPFESARSPEEFRVAFASSLRCSNSTIVEAKVVARDINVQVHREIATQASCFITNLLDQALARQKLHESLAVKTFSVGQSKSKANETLLLLHGWMGDMSDWEEVVSALQMTLPENWSIIAVNLPGHGGATPDMAKILTTLGLDHDSGEAASGQSILSIDSVAESVMKSVAEKLAIDSVSAIAGYSFGGRVAMAMNRISQDQSCQGNRLVKPNTLLILLGANPGEIGVSESLVTSNVLRERFYDQKQRMRSDMMIASKLRHLSNRVDLTNTSIGYEIWSGFLQTWYGGSIWGDLLSREPDLYKTMVEKRARALCARAKDLATIVEECSPSANPNLESKSIDVSSTLYIAGALDEKYSNLGKEWKALEPELKFAMVPDSGHALLTEAPNYVAHQISMFLLGTEKSRDRVEKEKSEPKDLLLFTVRELVKTKTTDTEVSETTDHRHPSSMDFEPFAIDINSGKSKQSKGVVGIGWGDKAKSNEQSRMQQRRGFIVQLLSSDGATVGIGEVSPLSGLHEESLKDAENDLERIKAALKGTDITLVPIINPMSVLALDGALGEYIDAFLNSINIRSLCSSVRAGLEMALISFSSHLLRKPVLDCLTQYAARKPAIQSVLPISGLIPRGKPQLDDVTCRYPSLKVKVGHQDASRDAASLSLSLHLSSKLRPDANRAWTEADALQFSTALDGLGVNLIDKIEFVEEPIQKVSGDWSLREQVQVLERWYRHSGLKYALDESIADLVEKHERDFVRIKDELIDSFDDVSGCAAVVLKPSLLGLELSLCIARIAHTDLGINVVFSCSFDSGVGLAYSAFLATTSDIISGLPANDLLPHGIGTFALLDGDTLSPSFGSYVNEKGLLGVASLSRSFFGLSLDEMKGSFPQLLEVSSPLPIENIEEYQASAATSSSGREISVVVSLPLPFSDDTACTRFTDLPQQSRWSPWLSSVAYIDADRESEWTLNVRGVKFSWRATSSVLEKPYKGIQWESISGLKNMGVVEFVPNEGEPDSCTMRVRMTIIAPRLLTALFPGASVFLEDFLRNKLLKWSLEMFRDVVKGDLALERGDMELGDALFGAVEGKANAIEATLSSPTSPVDNAGEENAA